MTVRDHEPQAVGVTVTPTTPRALTYQSLRDGGLTLTDFRLGLQRVQDHLDAHEPTHAGRYLRASLGDLASHLLGHAKTLQLFTAYACAEEKLRHGDPALLDEVEREAAAAATRALMVVERIRRLRTGSGGPMNGGVRAMRPA